MYVKNIYIRSGGGQSAQSVDHERRTVRVRVDTGALNSGKGVIVDSGTTDTYLNKKVGKEFSKAWKKITGLTYSHAPISLTPEQLRQLPTILIQCQAASNKSDPSIEDYKTIPGYAGNLDRSSPGDLLIAIPATSYMDFSPITRRYMSRLYFTETVGGVLGSNTMQGHNVVFDWENGRVGFAESSCAYDKTDVPKASLDDGYSTDCVVSDPILSDACVDSVDKSLCRHSPTNIALLGTERWTSIVESPGTDSGISCVEAAKDVSHRDPREQPVVTCNGEGVCEEERPCQLTCPELARADKVKSLPDAKQARYRCGDTFWSSCDYNCKQTRISSVAFSDGICHEIRRESRSCHTGACSRSDPCRVPFVVHAVVGFERGSLSQWSETSEEAFVEALVGAARNMTSRNMFEAGDVNVLSALPLYEDDADIAKKADGHQADILGFRVVAEIAVFNKASPFRDQSGRPRGPIHGAAQPTTASTTGDGCGTDELYVLAKQALVIKKDVFLNGRFMATIVDEMKSSTRLREDPAFRDVLSKDFNIEHNIVSAWTVRTEIDDDINYFGPQKPFMAKLYAILSGATIISTFFLIFLTLWSLLWACDDYWQGQYTCQRPFFGQSGPSYRAVDTTTDSDDVDTIEEQAMRGREAGAERTKSTYKLTTPKKRIRTSSSVLSNDSCGR